ncbi:MAG TPA: type II toxin-antitoxin system VapC family toxin, partial [Chromatiaceae bacterium]|nr:type II toxin-antitoxin system VapC family toxin [Chromatiaceae bacterium]
WFAACSDAIVSADWIVTEFASALSLKERRGEVTGQAARGLWEEFESFRGTGLRLVPVSRKAFYDAARMTRDAASGLRSGYSMHLAVALDVGASSLATTDGVLDTNARKHGLATIGFGY